MKKKFNSTTIILICCWFLSNLLLSNSLHIALHAQVAPFHKVVGSVITTDGLRRAFSKRKEVVEVQVFYPFQYDNFSMFRWDLIIIEGWFPMIDDFITLARIESPNVNIIYYCLDPQYPSIETTISLDVDGYATNSLIMEKILQQITNTIYLPLAADIEVMKPNQTIPRLWDCIYIGAGGEMIKSKPLLQNMLKSCTLPPFNLLLYGSHWESNPEVTIREAWKGFLPKDHIAAAYSSAKVVIASTIQDQANYGMINNRIFESLACGSLVISDQFQALQDMFGDLIFFVNNTETFQLQLAKIITHQESYLSRRQLARERILKYHTWDHRVISLLEFYFTLKKTTQRNSNRQNLRHAAALIVSDNLQFHGDFIYSVKPALEKSLEGNYVIHRYDPNSWNLLVQKTPFEVIRFRVIIAVLSPYDTLHQSFINYSDPSSEYQRVLLNQNFLQKTLCYIIGSPPFNVDFVKEITPRWYNTLTDIFDVVLYRDSFEKNKLIEMEDLVIMSRHNEVYECQISNRLHESREQRWQHAYGISVSSNLVDDFTIPTSSSSTPLVLCFNTSMSLCTRKIRDSILSNNKYKYTLVLIGGIFEDWLKFCHSDSELDCVFGSSEDDDDDDDIATSPSSSFSSRTDLLSRTIHFSAPHDELLSRICSAEIVYFLYNLQNEADSGDDQLWPLVTAAICNRPIHFLHYPNSHIDSILSDCVNWSGDYLSSSWKHANERLHGLASSKSKVSILSTYSNNAITTISQLSNTPLIFQPHTENFNSGRDGKICLYVQQSSQVCLLREYLEIEVKIPPKVSISCQLTLNFTFVLHSHLFADSIYHSDPFFLQISPGHLVSDNSTNSLHEMEKVYYQLDLEKYSSSCHH